MEKEIMIRGIVRGSKDNEIFPSLDGEYQMSPIHWVLMQIRQTGTKRWGEEVWVGYCIKGKGNYSMTQNNLTPMIVHNTYFSESECEEETRCMNTACKLNKTTAKSFFASKHMKVPKDMRSEGGWKNATTNMQKIKIDDLLLAQSLNSSDDIDNGR